MQDMKQYIDRIIEVADLAPQDQRRLRQELEVHLYEMGCSYNTEKLSDTDISKMLRKEFGDADDLGKKIATAKGRFRTCLKKQAGTMPMTLAAAFVMASLAFMLIVGCHRQIDPVPAVFSHTDEMAGGGEFIVLADRRIFATMAFINAAGYDTEMDGMQMHPVRLRVREMLSEKAGEFGEELGQWRKFYENNHFGAFAYNDFALSLTTDYPFKRIRPDSELGYPYVAQRLKQFPDILNEFWETTDLETIWDQVKPDYLAEIKQYDIAGMEDELGFVWKYLRMRRKDNYVFVHIPNLLDSHCHASGAGYENYYFCVEGPGNPYGFNTHEYLHTIVNDIVKEHYPQHADKLYAYYQAGKDGELSRSYQEPVTFTYECLIRAMCRRMRILGTEDPAAKKLQEDLAKQNSALGLVLINPFFRQLDDFEKSDMPFEKFVPILFEKLPEYTKPLD